MNYAQVKSQMNNIRREISNLKRQKMSLEKELATIVQERSSAATNYQTSYVQKQQVAKNAYHEKLAKPIEQKISDIQNQLVELQKQYEEQIAAISADEMLEGSSDKKSILEEVHTATSELENVIVEAVGNDFNAELNKQLKCQEIEIDEDKLEEIVGYFNTCTTEINGISRRNKKISGAITNLQNAIMGIPTDDITAPKAHVGIALLATLAILFFYKYVYPIYLIVLLFVIVQNLRRNYKILKTILVKKAVSDNVGSIEELIHKKIMERVDAETARVNSDYENSKAILESKLNSEKENLNRTTVAAEQSFSFDDSDIRETYRLTMQQKENRENTINEQLRGIETKINDNFSKLEEMQKSLDKFLGKLQAEYLDPLKIGKSYELDTKFLIDIVDKKPVFFEHPQESCVFLYDQESNANGFVRLLNLQLRGKLNPTVFTVDIVDVLNIGKEYLRFKIPSFVDGEEDESLKRLFRFITSNDDFKTLVNEYNEDLTLRVKDISIEFGDIVKYNKFMLEHDSLVKPFLFSFVFNYGPAELSGQELSQLFRNGGDVGMYFHVFIKKSEFIKQKDAAKAFTENFKKFYVLDDDGPKTRAKDWILSLLEDENTI